MTMATTMTKSSSFYPSLHPTRTHALHHHLLIHSRLRSFTLPPVRLPTSRLSFSSRSPSSYSHDNPLSRTEHQNRKRLALDQDRHRIGLPQSNSPPRLNISRSIPEKRKIPNVQKVLVVASGKGGVGKSTIAVNLAISISRQSKLKVGLLDLDVFGPSIPKLMGLDDGITPELTEGHALIPLRNHGISCMSIGFLISNENSEGMIAWRGMMVMKAVQQLLFDVDWRSRGTQDESGIDLLVIDMPPGTGDVALSLGQLVEIDGAVIVTTPQDIALIDVTKGVNMFKKLNIPIIGSVLNMSTFRCTNCGTDHEIFGPFKSFGRILDRHHIDVLGRIPLDLKISEFSDLGKPISIFDHNLPHHPSRPEVNPNHGSQAVDHKDMSHTDGQVGDRQELANPFIAISKKCIAQLFK